MTDEPYAPKLRIICPFAQESWANDGSCDHFQLGPLRCPDCPVTPDLSNAEVIT